MPNIDSIMHSRIFDPTLRSGILRLTRAIFSIDKFQKLIITIFDKNGKKRMTKYNIKILLNKHKYLINTFKRLKYG